VTQQKLVEAIVKHHRRLNLDSGNGQAWARCATDSRGVFAIIDVLDEEYR
jgi:hypothetical protein